MAPNISHQRWRFLSPQSLMHAHALTSSQEPKPKRAFKGVWIDKDIWDSKALTWFQKCLLAEIDSLDDGGGCFASNEYLADHFDSTGESIRVSIAKLKSDGWIVEVKPPKGREKMRHVSIVKTVMVVTKSVTAITNSVTAITETASPIIKEIPEERKEEIQEVELVFQDLKSQNENDTPKSVMEEWNKIEGLPKIRNLSSDRERTLKARLRDPWWKDAWREALKKIADSHFLMGQNDRGWKADIDWFSQPGAVTKIVEGKYHRNGTKPAPEPIDYSKF